MFDNRLPKQDPPLTQEGLSNLEQRAALPQQNFRERVVFVVARNLVPVIGVLFLGWSASNMVVLYFVDTLGGMWALVAALMTQFDPGLFSLPLLARAVRLGGLLGVSLIFVAFLAIPLGVPLVFVLAPADWSPQAAFADTSFVYGLLTILALSVVGMLRYVLVQQKQLSSQVWAQREFGLLFLRWVVMLILIYALASVLIMLGTFGIVLLVIGYAVTTVISELYPDRFLGWFDRNLGRADAENAPRAKRSRRKGKKS